MKRVVVGLGLGAVVSVLVLWHSCGGRANEVTHASGSASHVGHAAQVDPRTRPQASITGTVSAPDRAPIAGARVCAFAPKHEDLPRALVRDPRCTTSDLRGTYTIANLPAISYFVSAMARSFKPRTYHSQDPTFELHVGETRTGVDIAMEPGGAEVQGTITDRSGGPIPRAVVTISAHLDGVAAVETDADGHYVAWVDASLVFVNASADGYASEGDSGAAPGTFDLSLLPAATIEGTVVDLKTNEPVAGVQVYASRDLGAWAYDPDDITDEAGRFKLDRLRPRRYTILARGPHGTGTADSSYAVNAAQTISGLVIKLGPTYRIEGKVVVEDAPGTTCSDPYLGATLHSFGESLHGGSGSGGTVFVEGALPGTYDVYAGCRGFIGKDSRPKIEITDHDVTGLVWEVTTGATVRGHVRTKSGEPVANATVSGPEIVSVVSGTDGGYMLAGVRPGTLELTASAERLAPIRAAVKVQITARETVVQDFILEEGGIVGGTVVDPAGKALPGIKVELSPEAQGSTQHRDTVATDGTGAFAFAPVLSGAYTITASRDRDEVRRAITFDASHPTAVRVVLELHARGSIRGIVLDDHGAPAPDSMVSAGRESDYYSSPAASHLFEHDALTAADGTFVIDKLEAGRYAIRALGNDGSVAYAEHVALDGKVSLALEPLGSIEGDVRGLTGPELLVAARDSKAEVRRAERLLYGNGHFAIRALPPGHYVVTARAGKTTLTQDVALARGEHKTLVFVATPPVAVTGRVIDLATNAPLPGRRVSVTTSRGDFGDFEDMPEVVSTDASGRFRIEHVPVGIVMLNAEGDASYGGASIVQSIRGDTDVGDLGALKRRTHERSGKLGITWVDYPDDVPSDQRQFQIAAIDPKSAVAGTDLRVGDVVTTFDGIEAVPNNRSACWAIVDAPAGTAIRLGLARGPIVTVVLGPP